MSNENDSLFQQYRAILDQLEIGEKITRKETIQKLTDNNSNLSVTVIDNYRRAFEKANYLKFEDVGVYIKVRPLDMMSVSIAKLKEEYEKFLSFIEMPRDIQTQDDMEKNCDGNRNGERVNFQLKNLANISRELFLEKNTVYDKMYNRRLKGI